MPHHALQRAPADKVPAKRTKDFTLEERAVIRDRLRWQSAKELALVFGTSVRVITNIEKYA